MIWIVSLKQEVKVQHSSLHWAALCNISDPKTLWENKKIQENIFMVEEKGAHLVEQDERSANFALRMTDIQSIFTKDKFLFETECPLLLND